MTDSQEGFLIFSYGKVQMRENERNKRIYIHGIISFRFPRIMQLDMQVQRNALAANLRLSSSSSSSPCLTQA